MSKVFVRITAERHIDGKVRQLSIKREDERVFEMIQF